VCTGGWLPGSHIPDKNDIHVPLAYLCALFLVSGFALGKKYKDIVRGDYSEEENISMC
jgi:hypothetical protein